MHRFVKTPTARYHSYQPIWFFQYKLFNDEVTNNVRRNIVELTICDNLLVFAKELKPTHITISSIVSSLYFHYFFWEIVPSFWFFIRIFLSHVKKKASCETLFWNLFYSRTFTVRKLTQFTIFQLELEADIINDVYTN